MCGAVSAQSISIVSGNGQLDCQSCARTPILTFDPLVVQVNSASGAPLAGATVTWTFTNLLASQGFVSTPTSVTGSNGQTSTTVQVFPLLGELSFLTYGQGTVTATITALPAGTPGGTGQSVTFT
jgi:hypothetical protein